jgi:hypothetical protein
LLLPKQALEFASLDRIKLTHIRGNPLIRKDMAKHVDISRSVKLTAQVCIASCTVDATHSAANLHSRMSWCCESRSFCDIARCPPYSYKCAVVLCDMSWLDPDMEVANGIAATEQSDMLRLDAMILMVQLNIRKLVEVTRRLSQWFVPCLQGG